MLVAAADSDDDLGTRVGKLHRDLSVPPPDPNRSFPLSDLDLCLDDVALGIGFERCRDAAASPVVGEHAVRVLPASHKWPGLKVFALGLVEDALRRCRLLHDS